jgi:type IV pilus assembly protein PilW
MYKNEKGFSLIELMIAITIGLFLLLGLTVAFSYNTKNQNQLEKTLFRTENAQFALDQITEDIMHAGFFGRYQPSGVTYSNPGVCPTDLSAAGWNTSNATPQLPSPMVGRAIASTGACLSNRSSTSEALTISRADVGNPITIALAAAAPNTNRLFLQISGCNEDAKPIEAGLGNSTGFNLRRRQGCSVGSTNFADVVPIIQRTYYVATCNNCASNDGIPTLWRHDFNGSGSVTAIAEGVERLHFEYGRDTNGDGLADAYVTVGSVTGADWNDVVSVRLHMLIRSSARESDFTDNRTYTLGPSVTITAPNDGFRRTLLTTTIPLINVSGRRR